MTVFIQTQSNINKMYDIAKKNEVNNTPIKVEPVKKKDEKKSEEQIGLEIMNDKLNIFNDFNNFL